MDEKARILESYVADSDVTENAMLGAFLTVVTLEVGYLFER
jgi:hypothetical protein